MPWTPSKYYQPGPRCIDWRDNVPPHHDPPARPEVTARWLDRTRRQLAAARAHLHDEQQQRRRQEQPRHRVFPAPPHPNPEADFTEEVS